MTGHFPTLQLLSTECLAFSFSVRFLFSPSSIWFICASFPPLPFWYFSLKSRRHVVAGNESSKSKRQLWFWCYVLDFLPRRSKHVEAAQRVRKESKLKSFKHINNIFSFTFNQTSKKKKLNYRKQNRLNNSRSHETNVVADVDSSLKV